MRKLFAVSLLAGLLGVLVVAGPALSKHKSLEVDDNYFVEKGKPHTVTVHVGDTVEWEWEDDAVNPHNVTVVKAPKGAKKFHSKTQTSGSFEKKLKKAGTYKIVCTIHRSLGMKMTLKVKK
jgi:plastocyanin